MFTNFSKVDFDTIDSIAIGGFDGIHLGHQKLFSKLEKNGAILVIENTHMDLTPKRYREQYAAFPFLYLDLDSVVSLKGEEFVRLLEKTFKNLKKIIIGYDFCFGKDRSCNSSDLAKFFTHEVVIVKEVTIDNISVHSKKIRNLIRLGKIKETNKFLGREYSIEGEIIKGQGLGMRKLYPTLNLHIDTFLLPNEGVYATRTKVEEKIYNSVSFIGHRISTDGSFAIETHILDKCENFFCEKPEIIFVEKMRENVYYDKLEDLKAQIALDIKRAKTILS